MTDIAGLSFAIDSGQVVTAFQNLDNLDKAAQKTSQSIQDMQQQNAALMQTVDQLTQVMRQQQQELDMLTGRQQISNTQAVQNMQQQITMWQQFSNVMAQIRDTIIAHPYMAAMLTAGATVPLSLGMSLGSAMNGGVVNQDFFNHMAGYNSMAMSAGTSGYSARNFMDQTNTNFGWSISQNNPGMAQPQVDAMTLQMQNRAFNTVSSAFTPEGMAMRQLAANLGISVHEGQDPGDLMYQLNNKINQISNPGQRAQAARSVYGEYNTTVDQAIQMNSRGQSDTELYVAQVENQLYAAQRALQIKNAQDTQAASYSSFDQYAVNRVGDLTSGAAMNSLTSSARNLGYWTQGSWVNSQGQFTGGKPISDFAGGISNEAQSIYISLAPYLKGIDTAIAGLGGLIMGGAGGLAVGGLPGMIIGGIGGAATGAGFMGNAEPNYGRRQQEALLQSMTGIRAQPGPFPEEPDADQPSGWALFNLSGTSRAQSWRDSKAHSDAMMRFYGNVGRGLGMDSSGYGIDSGDWSSLLIGGMYDQSGSPGGQSGNISDTISRMYHRFVTGFNAPPTDYSEVNAGPAAPYAWWPAGVQWNPTIGRSQGIAAPTFDQYQRPTNQTGLYSWANSMLSNTSMGEIQANVSNVMSQNPHAWGPKEEQALWDGLSAIVKDRGDVYADTVKNLGDKVIQVVNTTTDQISQHLTQMAQMGESQNILTGGLGGETTRDIQRQLSDALTRSGGTSNDEVETLRGRLLGAQTSDKFRQIDYTAQGRQQGFELTGVRLQDQGVQNQGAMIIAQQGMALTGNYDQVAMGMTSKATIDYNTSMNGVNELLVQANSNAQKGAAGGPGANTYTQLANSQYAKAAAMAKTATDQQTVALMNITAPGIDTANSYSRQQTYTLGATQNEMGNLWMSPQRSQMASQLYNDQYRPGGLNDMASRQFPGQPGAQGNYVSTQLSSNANVIQNQQTLQDTNHEVQLQQQAFSGGINSAMDDFSNFFQTVEQHGSSAWKSLGDSLRQTLRGTLAQLQTDLFVRPAMAALLGGPSSNLSQMAGLGGAGLGSAGFLGYGSMAGTQGGGGGAFGGMGGGLAAPISNWFGSTWNNMFGDTASTIGNAADAAGSAIPYDAGASITGDFASSYNSAAMDASLNSLDSGATSGSGSGIWDFFSGLFNAQGGAWNGGVRFLAQGDTIGAGGSIVSSPTSFTDSSGMRNIMGEAGTEAVMPLTRGPGGSLGVKMYGGGNTPQQGHQIFVDARGAEVGVEQRVRNEISRLMPHINNTSSDHAVSKVKTLADQGGPFAVTVGRRQPSRTV